jgi:hypothetical protein
MIHQPPPEREEPPFTAEVTNVDTGHGKFEPIARITVGNGIRDLAKAIGLHGVGALTILVSYITSNGTIKPTARALKRAVGSDFLARRRLKRLARKRWRGQPVLHIITTAAGLELFKPSDAVVIRREASPAQTAAPTGAAAGVPQGDIGTSGIPPTRQAVEREIRARNGWPSEEEQAEARALIPPEPRNLYDLWAVQRLVKEQVDYSLAVKLVKEYGSERVLRQVRLLDRRRVKNRRRYVVAAVMNDYPAPARLDTEALGPQK